jgi:cation/acetate symporter
MLSRHVLRTSAREGRWSAAWALLFVAIFLSAVPALAAYAKLSVLTVVANLTEPANLPAWIFAYGRLGLVDICGHAAINAAAVSQACAALSDGPLRVQDLTLHPEVIALATPEMTGLDHGMFGILAAAALAAALVTADGPLAAVAGALGATAASRPLTYGIAAAALSVAAVAASMKPAGFLTVGTWAFLLAAAGLFPALVAGLWWQRANAFGAAAAMVVGLGVCLFYLIGTRFFAVSFFETWQSLSSAGPIARETFAELKEAWMAAAAGSAKDAAWTALDAHAQSIANLWGVKGLATAVLALPAGIAALIVVTLLTPARGRSRT